MMRHASGKLIPDCDGIRVEHEAPAAESGWKDCGDKGRAGVSARSRGADITGDRADPSRRGLPHRCAGGAHARSSRSPPSRLSDANAIRKSPRRSRRDHSKLGARQTHAAWTCARSACRHCPRPGNGIFRARQILIATRLYLRARRLPAKCLEGSHPLVGSAKSAGHNG
jgi:hypothetical protein